MRSALLLSDSYIPEGRLLLFHPVIREDQIVWAFREILAAPLQED